MKLCLIGSTRFIELFHEYNRRLTLAGHIVYSVAMFGRQPGEEVTKPNNVEVTDRQKRRLDLVHLKKILESEAVVIVSDETRYIGDSTRRELDWARLNGKRAYESGIDRLCRFSIWQSSLTGNDGDSESAG